MKKLFTLLLGVAFIIAGVPLLIHSWCCLEPKNHCSHVQKIVTYNDGKKKRVLVDKNGYGIVLDKDGKCGDCHHDISAHVCEEVTE